MCVPTVVAQGNVDPMVLFAKEDKIREEVGRVLGQAGSKHILGVGHGVIQVRGLSSLYAACRSFLITTYLKQGEKRVG
jgi:uroporphyrinogen-III decarboxylase